MAVLKRTSCVSLLEHLYHKVMRMELTVLGVIRKIYKWCSEGCLQCGVCACEQVVYDAGSII